MTGPWVSGVVRSVARWTAMAALALNLAGCGGGGGGSVSTATPAPIVPRGQWTVMVYMSGGNDLEKKVATNLNLMERVAQSSQVRIVVQCKTLKDTLIPTVGGSTTAKRFQVMHDDDPVNVTSPVLEDRGNADMDDPAELADFVKWADDRFPAQRHMLIMWDHAGSFYGFGGDEAAHGKGLSFTGIVSAFQSMQQTVGFRKWDLIGWDACMMASLEVDQALSPYASYSVASEELSPGEGWAYDRFLAALVANPMQGPVELGQAVVDASVPTWVAGKEEDVTLSVVDLSAVNEVATQINHLGTTLGAHLPAGMTATILPQRMKTMIFGKQKAIETGDFVDIGQLCTNLGTDPALFASTNAVLRTLGSGTGVAGRGAVIYTRSGPGSVGATGLQVYFPNINPVLPLYDLTPLGSPAAWGTFLVAYKAALAPLAQQVPGVTIDFSSPTASPGVPAVVRFTADPCPVGLYNQTLEIGQGVDATHVDTIGVFDLNRQTPGQSTTSWDARVLTLSDGTRTVALAARPDQPGSKNWQADVWFRPAGEDVKKGMAHLAVEDDGSFVLTGVATYNAENLISKPMPPSKGDELTPIYRRVDLINGTTTDADAATTLIVPDGGALTPAVTAVTGGGTQYTLLVWAQSFAETLGFARAQVTVP